MQSHREIFMGNNVVQTQRAITPCNQNNATAPVPSQWAITPCNRRDAMLASHSTTGNHATQSKREIATGKHAVQSKREIVMGNHTVQSKHATAPCHRNVKSNRVILFFARRYCPM
ncbi:MAG: hypothetical protein HC817_16310 [Saprospiraceae bacterium]|nr:hypothetical protein [Saprospiraceae bacterium]